MLPQLGLGGGGKKKVIYDRLNVLAKNSIFRPILLTFNHSVRQKKLFQEVVVERDLDPQIEHLTLFEAAARFQNLEFDLEESEIYWEWVKLIEFDAMKFQSEQARIVCQLDDGRIYRLYYLDEKLYTSHTDLSAGRVLKSYFVEGRPVGAAIYFNSQFETGYNLMDGTKQSTYHLFVRSFMKFLEQIDCVLFVDGITSAFAAATVQVPKVLYLHADHRLPDGTVVPRSQTLIERFACDVIATATEQHCRILHKELTVKRPIFVIPHKIDEVPKSATRRRNIVTVSRIHLDEKPIDECVNAFVNVMDKVSDDYLIFGDGPDVDKLQDIIDKLGARDRIKLMGYSNDPLELFKQSKLSIYPTLSEGFGLSLLESLSCGCPVVTYDVDFGPRELIVRDFNGQLVTPHDVLGIEKAILKVLNENKSYVENSTKNLKRYSKEAYRNNVNLLAKGAILLHKINRDEPVSILEELIDERSQNNFVYETFEKNWDLISKNEKQLVSYIKVLTALGQIDELIRVVKHVNSLFPDRYQALQRLMWLARKTDDRQLCIETGQDFKERFPEQYREFVEKFPYFADLERYW